MGLHMACTLRAVVPNGRGDSNLDLNLHINWEYLVGLRVVLKRFPDWISERVLGANAGTQQILLWSDCTDID